MDNVIEKKFNEIIGFLAKAFRDGNYNPDEFDSFILECEELITSLCRCDMEQILTAEVLKEYVAKCKEHMSGKKPVSVIQFFDTIDGYRITIVDEMLSLMQKSSELMSTELMSTERNKYLTEVLKKAIEIEILHEISKNVDSLITEIISWNMDKIKIIKELTKKALY